MSPQKRNSGRQNRKSMSVRASCARPTRELQADGTYRPIRTPRIPAKSALRPYVRRGVEGVCQVCGKAVTAHVSAKGLWLGCSSQQAPARLPLILIPDRRHHASRPSNLVERRTHSRQDASRAALAGTAAEMAPKVGLPPSSAQRAPSGPQVVYSARFPLSHAKVQKVGSERDSLIYRLIAKAKHGASRMDLLHALKTTRTGIVDGAVRRLRLRGLVEAVSV